MKRYYLTAITLLFCVMVSMAQQSQRFMDDLRLYHKALDLYQEDQYLAAQRLFRQAKDQTDDRTIQGNIAYYIANCAVRLNQNNADDLMEEFVQEYPASTKRNSAYIDVANFYFDSGKYRLAQKWYEGVDVGTLSRKQKNRYYFNNGYALLKANQPNEAKPLLQRVSDTEEYGSQAKYYLGYIAYSNDELEEAERQFNQVDEVPERNSKLSYYQADLNYKLGKFDKAVELAKEQLQRSNRQEQSELNRIIGQSLFNQGKFEEALPYLLEYRGERGKLNNNDYYQIGYAYYQKSDYAKAVETFNKIIDGENATAQNAYYHLAQSYIKQEKYEEALNAFKRAAEMDYSPEIQQDASYNYAKLSYEYGNPYKSTPEVILNYVETYPDSPQTPEMKELLIDSYFSSKNYREALRLLEDGRIRGNEQVYAKVAFYYGLQEFNASDYSNATVQLEKAIRYATDAQMKTRAQFWLGESHYQLNDFQKALENFTQVKRSRTDIPESDLLDYDMAYTHFKLKNYDKAITLFQQFTADPAGIDRTRLNDAYLRLGDSHFVTRAYWPAMESYNKSIEMSGPNADYAAFQKAISYGFVSKPDRKIEDLKTFLNRFNQSAYRDDVLYELGNTYIAQNQVQQGLNTYDRLIREFPSSIYTSQAMMRKGLQLYNDQKLEQALRVYKNVVEEFPGTPQANQAVASARLVYIDLGRTDEYAQWVRGLDFVSVTDSELDDTAYESAEKPYLENNMQAAVRQLKGYLEQFPTGAHALQAHFYLAQAHYALDQKDAAIPHYEYVAGKRRSEFSEQALARLSEIYLGKSAFAKAVPVLKKLETLADFPQNKVFAESNLMKSYYELENYPEAKKYAQKVLQRQNLDNAVKADAQVIIARSAMKTGDENSARTAYEKVAETAQGRLAAEATYYKAFFQNKDGNHDGAIATVNAMTKNYSGYKLWIAKGLVVMAKSYNAKGETLNATTLLEGVIKNFDQYPEVTADARQNLNRIKQEAAKTNSSVNPSGN